MCPHKQQIISRALTDPFSLNSLLVNLSRDAAKKIHTGWERIKINFVAMSLGMLLHAKSPKSMNCVIDELNLCAQLTKRKVVT